MQGKGPAWIGSGVTFVAALLAVSLVLNWSLIGIAMKSAAAQPRRLTSPPTAAVLVSPSPIPTTQPPPAPSSWVVAVAQADLPGGLNAGTCVGFDPTGPARNVTVFLDAGHGGADPGTVGTDTRGASISEKTATLGLELAAADLLRGAGYRVIVSRTADSTVAKLLPADYDNGTLTANAVRLDLLARAACANAGEANLLVSLHYNGDSNPAVGGTTVLYDDARTFTAANLRFATAMQTALIAAYRQGGLNINDYGTTPDSSGGTSALTARGAAYGHLIELGPPSSGWVDHPSTMPGVLVEALYLTRPTEADIAATASGRQLVAHGLLAGIESYLGP